MYSHLLCLDHCTFVKQKAGRSDYAFHAYSEVCQFVYCLLIRSRKVSSLPALNDWESYMEPSKLQAFEKVSTDDFLQNYEFGAELHRSNTDEAREFRNRCREFVDRLVDVILGQQVVSSDFFQGLYCFCPEQFCPLRATTSMSFSCSLVWFAFSSDVAVSPAVMHSRVVRSSPHSSSMLGRGIRSQSEVRSRSKMLLSICFRTTVSCLGEASSGY